MCETVIALVKMEVMEVIENASTESCVNCNFKSLVITYHHLYVPWFGRKITVRLVMTVDEFIKNGGSPTTACVSHLVRVRST